MWLQWNSMEPIKVGFKVPGTQVLVQQVYVEDKRARKPCLLILWATPAGAGHPDHLGWQWTGRWSGVLRKLYLPFGIHVLSLMKVLVTSAVEQGWASVFLSTPSNSWVLLYLSAAGLLPENCFQRCEWGHCLQPGRGWVPVCAEFWGPQKKG